MLRWAALLFLSWHSALIWLNWYGPSMAITPNLAVIKSTNCFTQIVPFPRMCQCIDNISPKLVQPRMQRMQNWLICPRYEEKEWWIQITITISAAQLREFSNHSQTSYKEAFSFAGRTYTHSKAKRHIQGQPQEMYTTDVSWHGSDCE